MKVFLMNYSDAAMDHDSMSHLQACLEQVDWSKNKRVGMFALHSIDYGYARVEYRPEKKGE